MRYVYLVRGNPNHYKVGVAGDVLKRVRSLQTSNSHKIDIVACKRTPDALSIEKKIHDMLYKEKSSGGREWFILTPEQAIEIAIYINEIPFYIVSDVDEVKELMINCLAVGKKVNGRMEQLLKNFGHEFKNTKETKNIVHSKIDSDKMQEKQNLDYELQRKAIEIIKNEGRASASFLQVRLGLGYGRATRIIDQLELQGIVGPMDGSKNRKILI